MMDLDPDQPVPYWHTLGGEAGHPLLPLADAEPVPFWPTPAAEAALSAPEPSAEWEAEPG
jgi:hypothetical protein